MSFDGLLNQSITTYPRTSYDEYGREVVGSATTLSCRFQRKTKQRLAPNGSVIVIDAIVFVPTASDIDTGDKVTYDGADYKVISRYDSVDGDGNTHHLTLEVAKWLM